MARKPAGKQVRDGAGKLVAVRGRAANGAGSIYRDGDSYRATWRDATGKLRRVSGRTKAEAAKRRAEKIQRQSEQTGGTLGNDPTVAQVCDWWMEHIAAGRVGDGTRATYTDHLARITARIGGVPMRDITRESSVLLVEQLAKAYARSSVEQTLRTWRQVIDEALELGYLRRDPTRRVRIPDCLPGKKLRYLTVEEIHALASVLDGRRRWDSAVAILFLEGWRVSEALGLGWADIDFDAGTAEVKRACTAPGKGGPRRLGPPKTAGAMGVHHLAPTTVRVLRERRSAQRKERLRWGRDWPTWAYGGEVVDLVHTNVGGGLPARQQVYKAVRDACERAGVDGTGVGCHTGRRSVITALAEAEDVADIARLVGHAQTSTTEGYVQSYGERPREVAERAHALLDPAVGDGTPQ